MRHGDKINNLSRTAAHRKALLRNLSIALIAHKRIVTTLAKAKALRTHIEPLITKTKKADNQTQIMHQHRVVFSYLQDKAAVKELFTVIAPKIVSRPGGYTRILKLGARIGDNAEQAMIELVDFNEIYTGKSSGIKEGTKKTRRGSGNRKKTEEGTSSTSPTSATTVVKSADEASTTDTTEKTAE